MPESTPTHQAPSTRERILHCAIPLFANCGFAGVSMRDIAKTVGISPPALYNHFANKDELYHESISTSFADKSTRLLATLEGDAPAIARLEAFIYAMTREIEQDDHFRRLLQRELLDADSSRLTFLGGFILDKIQQPFMQLLLQLKPDTDAFLLSEIIFGMVKQHYELQPIHPHTSQGLQAYRSSDQTAAAIMQVLSPYFAGEKP
ncbi:MAG: TetR/AcrR family transcriptional regulator [bacterium]